MGQVAAADVELVRVMPPNAPDVKLEHESQTADLLILGTHGHLGVLAGLLGSTSRAVAREAVCPVALVNDTCSTDVHRCVVVWGESADEGDVAVLDWAVDFARRMRLPLHIITPWQPRAGDLAAGPELGAPGRTQRHHEVAVRYLSESAAGLAWTGSIIEGAAGTVVGQHTYDHDVVAVPQDGADNVQSVVRKARGVVVVVPSEHSSAARREAIEV